MLSYIRRHRSRFLGAAYTLAAVVIGLVIYPPSWKREPRLPGPGDPTYEEYVEAFELGTAAIDGRVWDVAEENLNRATKLIPQEPAAWANRAMLKLRMNRLPEAEPDLAEAERLAPGNLHLAKLRARLEERRGRYAEAVAALRPVVENDPGDVESTYFLAQLILRWENAESDAEYQRLMQQILAVRPHNRLVMRERLRTAVRRADRAAVNDTIARLRIEAPSWVREETRFYFAAFSKAAEGTLVDAVDDTLLPFTNLYLNEPGYDRDADEVGGGGQFDGRPVRTFLKLAPARHTPAPPDTEITFTPEPIAGVPAGRWETAVPVWLTGEGNPVVFLANAKELRWVGSPAVLPSIPLAPDGLVPIDWNNDYRTDLLVVGPGGLLFYQQGADGNFTDVTAKTKLPTDILKGDYTAALAADIDMDGDLDILLARRNGSLLLLRNNFDDTFTALPIFPEVKDARAFAWADLDHDGFPDAVVLDAQGKLHVFFNGCAGRFRPAPVALPDGPFLAMTISDADDDGVLDLIAIRADGAILRISDRNKQNRWSVTELAWWETPAGTEPGSVRLFTGDLDNNGVPDLIVSGSSGGTAWLGSSGGIFDPLPTAIPARTFAAIDFDSRGRLDLLSLDAEGRPVRLRNTGKKDYHWLTVHARGVHCPPDSIHTNSFSIGGEVEIRTGTHVVKRSITTPVAHFGLGNRTRCDIIRVGWPNGRSRIEFARPIDTTVVIEQRVKGW